MLKTIGFSFAVTVAVIAGALSASALREAEASPGTAMHVATDRDLHLGAQYAYEVSSTRTLDGADGSDVTRTTVGGTLVLTVVGETTEGVALRGELRYATRTDVPAAAASAHELAAPFYVVAWRDGSVARIAFSKATSPEARRHLRSIVAAIAVGVTKPDSSWNKDERFTGRVLTTRTRTTARLVALGEAKDLVGRWDAEKGSFETDPDAR